MNLQDPHAQQRYQAQLNMELQVQAPEYGGREYSKTQVGC